MRENRTRGSEGASGSNALFPATAAMLAPDLAAGNLVTLDFAAPEMQTEYGIITLTDRTLAPVMLAFLDLLREVEAEIAAAEARTVGAAAAPARRPPRRRVAKS